jgi:hypothetical protein
MTDDNAKDVLSNDAADMADHVWAARDGAPLPDIVHTVSDSLDDRLFVVHLLVKRGPHSNPNVLIWRSAEEVKIKHAILTPPNAERAERRRARRALIKQMDADGWSHESTVRSWMWFRRKIIETR